MSERLNAIFPFLIAVLLPPAGVLLGIVEIRQDRELGMRLIAVSVLAALVWVLLFVP